MPDRRLRHEKIITFALQRYWKVSRGLTMGAQGLVFNNDNKILLVRHTYRSGWFFPGGGVERNESLISALTRELEEEAGILISQSPRLIGVFAHFKNFPSDHIALFEVPHFTQPNPPAPNAEIAEHGFFAPESLPPDTSDGTRRRIKEFLNGKPPAINW